MIEYRNAVQVAPGHGVARQKLAEAYLKTNNLKGAYEEYIRAADLMPNNAEAQVQAAELLLVARQWEDASTRAEKALAIDPKNAKALVLRGQAKAGLKDLPGAISEIEQAIKSALYGAFAHKQELTDQHLIDAINTSPPLSVTMAERIEDLRNWATGRCVPAD